MVKAAHIKQAFILRDGVMLSLNAGELKLKFQYDEKAIEKPEKNKKKKLKKS